MSLTIHLFCLVWFAVVSSPTMGGERLQTTGSAKISKAEVALRKCVGAFWTAWQQKDYQLAGQYVIPDQKERFKSTKKFPVRKWEIIGVQLLPGNGQATVTVKIERFEPVMGDYFEWKQTATWLKRAAVWQMQIPEGRLGSPGRSPAPQLRPDE